MLASIIKVGSHPAPSPALPQAVTGRHLLSAACRALVRPAGWGRLSRSPAFVRHGVTRGHLVVTPPGEVADS